MHQSASRKGSSAPKHVVDVGDSSRAGSSAACRLRKRLSRNPLARASPRTTKTTPPVEEAARPVIGDTGRSKSAADRRASVTGLKDSTLARVSVSRRTRCVALRKLVRSLHEQMLDPGGQLCAPPRFGEAAHHALLITQPVDPCFEDQAVELRCHEPRPQLMLPPSEALRSWMTRISLESRCLSSAPQVPSGNSGAAPRYSSRPRCEARRSAKCCRAWPPRAGRFQSRRSSARRGPTSFEPGPSTLCMKVFIGSHSQAESSFTESVSSAVSASASSSTRPRRLGRFFEGAGDFEIPLRAASGQAALVEVAGVERMQGVHRRLEHGPVVGQCVVAPQGFAELPDDG